ncbi:uncharacterized protein BDZ99DRAFT_477576 [Mytilinidion resinicola]|uniref:RING-type domain-containing protein n=1 Tax=Mytilinidion resinicola TaxID=574789 RepID=A0A6A6YJZ8_9PEZI|nr:uncharacterized protein BDZ99DRAFT_477576 [Mytilinidion resinicola]KAF2809110.1 hypothetical protein BDZ99DRAFT_477576 [Mytilinidion resinicola]
MPPSGYHLFWNNLSYTPWPTEGLFAEPLPYPRPRIDARVLEQFLPADRNRALQGLRMAAIDEFLAPMILDRLRNERPRDTHHYREIFMANHPIRGQDFPTAEQLEPLLVSARGFISHERQVLGYDYFRVKISREIWNEAMPYLGLQDGWHDGANLTRIIASYIRFDFVEGRPTWRGAGFDDDVFNAAVATPIGGSGGVWRPGANQGEDNGQHSVLDVAVRCQIPDSEPECSICREELEYDLTQDQDHGPVRTACQHVFGESCLQSWLLGFPIELANCPMCRRPLRRPVETTTAPSEVGQAQQTAENTEETIPTAIPENTVVNTMAEARQLAEHTQGSMNDLMEAALAVLGNLDAPEGLNEAKDKKD